MTQSPDYAVYLGAQGFAHAAWVGAFYPDDLPEDWRFAYYASQFRAVFLPHPLWTLIAPTQWQAWVQDCQPTFRFVLEAGPAGGEAGVIADLLGQRLGAVAQRDDPRLLWFDAGSDLKALRLTIEQRPKPLYLFSRDADLAMLQRVATLLDLMGL
ncbi:MAG: hypothetical protein RMK60_00545 [Burkholderiales bacterium]|nr:hypothetical protein [Burkholderiales bacterium]